MVVSLRVVRVSAHVISPSFSPHCYHSWSHHRIIESSGLEDTFQIIQSSRKLGIASVIPKPSCSARSRPLLNISGAPPPPCTTYSNAWPPEQWKIFSNVLSEFLLSQFKAITSSPITAGTAGETSPHLTENSLSVENDEIFHELPLLQTKQTQLPQLFLVVHVF